MRLTRRRFVMLLGTSTAATGVTLGYVSPAVARQEANPSLRFLTPTEAATTLAACECLIGRSAPAHPASCRTVLHYIDAQLAGPWGQGASCRRGLERGWASGDGGWQPGTLFHCMAGNDTVVTPDTPAASFRRALGAVHGVFGAPFASLERSTRIAVLESWQAGTAVLNGVSAQPFFRLLLQLTVEGLFAGANSRDPPDRLEWPVASYPGAASATRAT